VPPFQLPIPGDTGIPHSAVDRGDDLHMTRPILGYKSPLDRCVVAGGHAHEPPAVQSCLPAAPISKANEAADSRGPDVKLV
jgi:hypothetical protein